MGNENYRVAYVDSNKVVMPYKKGVFSFDEVFGDPNLSIKFGNSWELKPDGVSEKVCPICVAVMVDETGKMFVLKNNDKSSKKMMLPDSEKDKVSMYIGGKMIPSDYFHSLKSTFFSCLSRELFNMIGWRRVDKNRVLDPVVVYDPEGENKNRIAIVFPIQLGKTPTLPTNEYEMGFVSVDDYDKSQVDSWSNIIFDAMTKEADKSKPPKYVPSWGTQFEFSKPLLNLYDAPRLSEMQKLVDLGENLVELPKNPVKTFYQHVIDENHRDNGYDDEYDK